LFVITTIFYTQQPKTANISIELTASRAILRNVLITIYSILGILFIGALANKMVGMFGKKIGDLVMQMASYTFGIYIYQQFVLKWLYYYSPVSELSPSLLPWVGAFLALVLSIILTWLTRLNKLGRMLIG